MPERSGTRDAFDEARRSRESLYQRKIEDSRRRLARFGCAGPIVLPCVDKQEARILVRVPILSDGLGDVFQGVDAAKRIADAYPRNAVRVVLVGEDKAKIEQMIEGLPKPENLEIEVHAGSEAGVSSEAGQEHAWHDPLRHLKLLLDNPAPESIAALKSTGVDKPLVMIDLPVPAPVGDTGVLHSYRPELEDLKENCRKWGAHPKRYGIFTEYASNKAYARYIQHALRHPEMPPLQPMGLNEGSCGMLFPELLDVTLRDLNETRPYAPLIRYMFGETLDEKAYNDCHLLTAVYNVHSAGLTNLVALQCRLAHLAKTSNEEKNKRLETVDFLVLGDVKKVLPDVLALGDDADLFEAFGVKNTVLVNRAAMERNAEREGPKDGLTLRFLFSGPMRKADLAVLEAVGLRGHEEHGRVALVPATGDSTFSGAMSQAARLEKGAVFVPCIPKPFLAQHLENMRGLEEAATDPELKVLLRALNTFHRPYSFDELMGLADRMQTAEMRSAWKAMVSHVRLNRNAMTAVEDYINRTSSKG